MPENKNNQPSQGTPDHLTGERRKPLTQDGILTKNTVRRQSPKRIMKKWKMMLAGLPLKDGRSRNGRFLPISDTVSKNGNDGQGSSTYSKNVSNYWVFGGITFKR